MSGFEKELKQAGWALIFLAQTAIEVNIVQIEATSAKEFDSIAHFELVWVSDQVQAGFFRELWKKVRVDWLLRHVRI